MLRYAIIWFTAGTSFQLSKKAKKRQLTNLIIFTFTRLFTLVYRLKCFTFCPNSRDDKLKSQRTQNHIFQQKVYM